MSWWSDLFTPYLSVGTIPAEAWSTGKVYTLARSYGITVRGRKIGNYVSLSVPRPDFQKGKQLASTLYSEYAG